jgi:hypothetical protein
VTELLLLLLLLVLVNTRCNGGDENDVMEVNDDNDFLYRFDSVPNNDR